MSSITHIPKGRESIHSKSTTRREQGDMSSSSEEYNDDTTIPNTSNENSWSLINGEGREKSPVNESRSNTVRDNHYVPESYRQEQRRAYIPNEPRQRAKADIRNEQDLRECSVKGSSYESSNVCRYFFVAVAILAVCAYYYYSQLPIPAKECTYENLSNKYPQQDKKMWRTLSVAIENIQNKRSKAPAVNLFVHQGSSRMENLVREIAAETSKCFDENSKLVQMSEKDFTSPQVVDDYGYAVDAFKNKIKNGRVAVIVNLNKIPPKAARALHTICDTITPIAEEIAIFLTLVTPTAEGNPVANAEDTLERLWGSKLKRNELDALITRVTDQVLALKSLN